jgi:glycosyltransferase involved in cell wall biosynthesis
MENSFDPEFYVKMYPDIKRIAKYGNKVLYNHYITTGKKQGRICNEDQYKKKQAGSSEIYQKNTIDTPVILNNKYNYITFITVFRNTKPEYLRECIMSLINQTSNNWYSVIVNDFSKNIYQNCGSVHNNDKFTIDSILGDEFKEFKYKFTVINLDEWNGIINCHKIGLIYCKTDIVGILDSDDTLTSNTVNEILAKYNSEDDNVFVYSNFWYCDSDMNKKIKGYGKPVEQTLLSDRCGNHLRTFKLQHYYMTSGYDNDLIYGGEDKDILCKLEQHARPVYLNKELYNYRTYENNTISMTGMKRLILYSGYLYILKNIANRNNNLNFELRIFSDKSKIHNEIFKSSRCNSNNKIQNVTIDGVKYWLELYSNDIYIESFKYDINKEYINEYLKNYTECAYIFQINIDWSYKFNEFIISNKLFNLENFSKIHPNTYFDNIYIINLDRDIQKRNRMSNILEKYNITYEIFNAVYGTNYISEYNEKQLAKTMKSIGAFGYSMSMIKILQDAKEKKYRKILVFDDDIILCNNFCDEFDKKIKSIPYDWKVLFFGLTGPWVVQHKEITNYSFKRNYITDLTNCDGSYAVGYDISMYDTIIGETKKFAYPFDTQLIKYLNINKQIDSYAFYPYLAIADTTVSSISDRNSNVLYNFKTYQCKFKINLNNYDLDSVLGKKYSILNYKIYPKVSIIVIIKTNSNFLLISIDSIVKQTYKNYEIVIIKCDESINLKKYDKYPNIKVIDSNNISIDEVKKLAYNETCGDIVMFHDVSNYCVSNRLQLQVSEIVYSNKLICGANAITISDHCGLEDKILSELNNSENKQYFDFKTIIYKKDILDKYKIYDDNELLNKLFNKMEIINEDYCNLSNDIYVKINDPVLIICK